MTTALNNKVSKMSNTVLQCEHRAAWQEVESQIRCGLAPQKTVSDYIAVLDREMKRRNVQALA